MNFFVSKLVSAKEVQSNSKSETENVHPGRSLWWRRDSSIINFKTIIRPEPVAGTVAVSSPPLPHWEFSVLRLHTSQSLEKKASHDKIRWKIKDTVERGVLKNEVSSMHFFGWQSIITETETFTSLPNKNILKWKATLPIWLHRIANMIYVFILELLFGGKRSLNGTDASTCAYLGSVLFFACLFPP